MNEVLLNESQEMFHEIAEIGTSINKLTDDLHQARGTLAEAIAELNLEHVRGDQAVEIYVHYEAVRRLTESIKALKLRKVEMRHKMEEALDNESLPVEVVKELSNLNLM